MSVKLEVILKLKDSFTNGMNKAEGKFQKSVKNLKSSWKSLITLPNLVAAAAPALLTKNLVNASMEMEAIESKMKGALPVFGAADREFNFLSEEADRLGLNLQKTAGEYATFTAATTRAGLTVKQTRQIFSDISEASIALKLPAHRIGLVFTALTQMASKGYVSLEELKRQLGDSLPAAVQIGARAMGMSNREFQKAVSQQEIVSKEFLPKFAAQVKKELGGSFGLASKQIQASLNRMQTGLFRFRVMFGDLIKEDVQVGIDNLAKGFNWLYENINLVKAVFEALKIPVIIAWNAFQILGDTVGFLILSLIDLGKFAVVPIIEGFELIINTAKLAGAALRAIAERDFSKLKEIGVTELGLIKESIGTIKESFKTGFDEIKIRGKTWFEEQNKNIQDIADQLAKTFVAFERASIKRTQGKTGAIEPGLGGDEGGEGPDDKALKREKKLHQQWLKLQKERQRQDFAQTKAIFDQKQEQLKLELESQAVYEEVRINLKENYFNREHELLDLEYKKEQAKYAGNKIALANIDKAYALKHKLVEKDRIEFQKGTAKQLVDTTMNSFMEITRGQKKFVGLYKTAAIIQIMADTFTTAQAAYKGAVQAFQYWGIPIGATAAAAITAGGIARAQKVATQKFAYGTRTFRTSGPQMILVGENPGGREKITVRPESSQNVNGPSQTSETMAVFHFHDNSGNITETVRQRIRAGGEGDRLVRDLLSRGRAIGALT